MGRMGRRSRRALAGRRRKRRTGRTGRTGRKGRDGHYLPGDSMKRIAAGATVVLLAAGISSANGQYAPGKQGSDDVRVVGHLPLGGELSATDVDLEQELS